MLKMGGPIPTTPETPNIPALEQRRGSILAALTTLGDMCPGSLVHRFMKCSKPTCRCHHKDHPDHGPYYVLVRKCALRRYVNLEAQALAQQGRNPRSASHNGVRLDCG